ncbi:hypothetical protein HHK36_024311 [Tetracentron sinense]|uniref:HTH myb-type domain-containing protein n=1 Tax=Tetracentron sinense TaxID=13715 RepID=A0A834Y636_TETSI|nr:hypothetical protein HHK36_032073 [Tetracentron sinense]KAF8389792.1 hypothetical protein HHK36_024311 [Tetracentron sinense]
MDYSEKMREYVEALEEERRKIQVFHRELPLCVELVNQAINSCRQQITARTTEFFPGRSEFSEQISSEGHVFEEFIPLKRTSSSEDDEQSFKPQNNKDMDNDRTEKKADWLRSAQLWNQDPVPLLKEDLPRKIPVTEMKKNGGAFHPLNRGKCSSTKETTSVSSAETVKGGGGRREEKERQSHRKARRCWSPDLHRRFLHALQQLGGSHAGTPKQIRELMKVDDLTNDEVKSHLQKYRIHTSRHSPAIHNNGYPQPPKVVMVGGVWLPPPEYAAVAASAGEATRVTAAKEIFTPVASSLSPLSTSLSQQHQNQKQSQKSPMGPLHSGERESRAEQILGYDDTHSNSQTTSSSTNTTTASPVF